ncbi:uncharacterized protein AB675_8187 [Cyphellophora attinorum]|uniref:Mid2 domain-containing protein n=1 Tax=Cyphellophora attinorum TaxID=1664694 RepID=A0A0N1NZS5_9EURO|nr:uncharacterized protein AB675_8187 [Phialophora attinorum]KPI41067.1 hypothetical protein AB675_8187 [Phialophora attinorum]
MRQAFVVLLSFLLFSAVRAIPFGVSIVQERHIITENTRLYKRQLLDALDSIANDISSAFDPDPEPTPPPPPTPPTPDKDEPAATKTPKKDDDDEDDDETTTARSTATKTSSKENTKTKTSASARSTSTETSSETSVTSESTSESTTSATSTSATSASTAAASATPEPTSASKGGVNTAAVAGGIAAAIVVIAALVIILFWGCGPLKRWKENREYQQMVDRTYRPALDDKVFFADKPRSDVGLYPTSVPTSVVGGASVVGAYRGAGPAQPSPVAGHQRPFSFNEESRMQQGIRRKPLPTIGTGGATEGASPLTGASTPTTTGHDRAEPWLPGGGTHR